MVIFPRVMIPESFTNALRTFNSVVGNKARWAVDRSTALALQGFDLEPGDIDILTDREGAYRIQGLLAGYAVRPVAYSESNKYRSHYGSFSIDGVRVEVMGDFQECRNGTWGETRALSTVKISQVALGNDTIPVVSLESLRADGYLSKRIGREAGTDPRSPGLTPR
jgi:hypothetical protein